MQTSPLLSRIVTIALRWCVFISLALICLTYVPRLMPTLLVPGLVGGLLMLAVLLAVIFIVLFGPPPGLTGSLNKIAYRPALITGCVMTLVVMAALAINWAQDLRVITPPGGRGLGDYTSRFGMALKLLYNLDKGLMFWKSQFANLQQTHVADLLRAFLGVVLALTPFPVAIAALRRDKTLVADEKTSQDALPMTWRQDRWAALAVLTTTLAAVVALVGARWAIGHGMTPRFYDVGDLSLLPTLATIVLALGVIFLLEVFLLAADVTVDTERMLRFRSALGEKAFPLAEVAAIRLHPLGLDTVIVGGKAHLVCFPECIHSFLAFLRDHYPQIIVNGVLTMDKKA